MIVILIYAKILTYGVNKMQKEKEDFIDLREELSQKLEPLVLDSKRADWDFYINSTKENMKKSQFASDRVSEIFKNEATYQKFMEIDKTKLSNREAKQLKDIIKSFEDELNTGEAKKALRDKENEIAQKYNSYIPTLNGKEISRLEISRIMESEAAPQIRKQAYEAKIKGGDLIAEDLRVFAKMRNDYAKTKGYETYFNYILKEDYDVDSQFLDKLIGEVYSNAKDKIQTQQVKKEQELQNFYHLNKLENYHYGLLLASDPEQAVNEILEKHSVEDLTKKAYAGMGYDIDKMVKDGKLVLDLYPRKNKNTHGFCFDIEAGRDARILANLRNNVSSLDTFCHEMGHSVYELGISEKLSFFDKDSASAAVTEAIAMMMGDLMKKENILSDILSEELLNRFKASLKKDEAYFVARSLEIIEFERDMYNNPAQDLSALWQEKRAKYLYRNVEADNEWATIPHYLSHPAYYQNYFRAALMKAQIYNHLQKELGNITENTGTAKYLDEHIFAYGASINEYDLIRQLTGKNFTSEDFVRNLR